MTPGDSLSRLAVRYLRDLSARKMPAEVRTKVATCLLDFWSCRITAQSMDWAPALQRFMARQPTGAAERAFGNAVLGHGLIREDMHVASASHIGVVVLPAMLALAEREGLSGRDLLRGIVAGYDMMARLGAAVRQRAVTGTAGAHFRPLGICGAFGVAAAGVAALHLDEEVGVNALGFAANFAAGLNQWAWDGGQDIYVHAGMAASHGLIALDLARAGMVSAENVLEGRDGLFAAYGSGQHAARHFADSLKQADHAIMGVRHKPFSGCNYVQTPIAAALHLHLAPDDIFHVAIHTFSAARNYPGCTYAGPFTKVEQAKMSLHYAVSAALLYGRVDEAAYRRFDDPQLLHLVSLCEVVLDAALEAAYPHHQPSRIAVTLRDRRTLVQAMDDVPWLSAPAVQARFRAEAEPVLGADRTADIVALAHGLWDLPDGRVLAAIP